MSAEFPKFAKLVVESVKELTKTPQVFVANTDGDALYALYIKAFPPGTNPVLKKFTEHECSCCKQFIRRAGALVAVTESGNPHRLGHRRRERAVPVRRRGADAALVRAGRQHRRPLPGRSKEARLRCPVDAPRHGGRSRRHLDHLHTGPLPRHLVVRSRTRARRLPHHGAGVRARPRRAEPERCRDRAVAHRLQQPLPRRRAPRRRRAVHEGPEGLQTLPARAQPGLRLDQRNGAGRALPQHRHRDPGAGHQRGRRRRARRRQLRAEGGARPTTSARPRSSRRPW
jgi:hypothetical protein